VNFKSLAEVSFSDFMPDAMDNGCVAALRTEPFQGGAAVYVDPKVAFAAVDVLLGGDGTSTGEWNRQLSEIELTLMEGLLLVAARECAAAWGSKPDARPEIEKLGSPQDSRFTFEPHGSVLAVGFELKIGTSTGALKLAIPAAEAAKLSQHAGAAPAIQSAGLPGTTVALWEKLGAEMTTIVDVRLQGPTMRLRDVLSIRAGDVFDLGEPCGAPMAGLVNGILKFHGEVVAAEGRRMFQIHSFAD
jgi:flagellar motor switch protein FliM